MTWASVGTQAQQSVQVHQDDNDEASRGQPATRMMSTCSTKMSSDNESDASRSQRQAVGGAPQARSGVERDNLREENGGMRMVVHSSCQTPCSDENQPSTSQRLEQMRRQCRGQLSEVNIGPTRATLDQQKTRTTCTAEGEDKEDTAPEEML